MFESCWWYPYPHHHLNKWSKTSIGDHFQFFHQVVEVPVQKQVHVPMVETVQKQVEVPQVGALGERKRWGGRLEIWGTFLAMKKGPLVGWVL